MGPAAAFYRPKVEPATDGVVQHMCVFPTLKGPGRTGFGVTQKISPLAPLDGVQSINRPSPPCQPGVPDKAKGVTMSARSSPFQHALATVCKERQERSICGPMCLQHTHCRVHGPLTVHTLGTPGSCHGR
jgi:hypothetical protein